MISLSRGGMNMNTAYAYKNRKEILIKSSSGGAFMGIVDVINKISTKNGAKAVVFGAAFDSEQNVVHKAAYTKEECFQFCGSKYVQSDTRQVYKEIATLLSNGQIVLFTGTPCQIAAVKAYTDIKQINQEYLYLVDIVCHGTPDKKIWKEYVSYLEEKNHSKLIKFCFRYKIKGWKGYPIYAEFANGTKKINTHDVSTYQILFRKNLLLKEVCFNCKFAGNFKSDLTIADFWGVDLCMPEIPTAGGVSLILAHNVKGNKLVNSMSEMCQNHDMILKRITSDRYLKYNHNLLHKSTKPSEYDDFWNDYREHGMQHVLKRYGEDNLKGKMKFLIKRTMRDSGMLGVVKKILRKA